MSVVVQAEGLSKRYRLGVINRSYLYRDLQSFMARTLGRPDPNAEIDARISKNHQGIIWALQDVNLEIKDGDVVGVIGRNGSGKSTLLKILSRITSPTKGVARIKGRVASLLEVGTGFHPELTGRDNVYLNGSILGMPKGMIQAKFDEIVAFSGVEDFIDTPVKRYSSGMKVRLAFAVAANLEPDILIVDEVLAVGDAEFQKKCLGKIGEAAKGGRTILFVSHNASAVENLCTKGIVLSSGRVAFTGSQKEAIQFYADSSEKHSEPLSERTDRRGTGELRVLGIRLKDGNGRQASVIASGDALTVEMKYENPHKLKFPHLVVGLNLKTHLDVSLLHLNNHVTGDSVAVLDEEKGTITCHFKNVPLLPGVYRFDYRVATQPKGARLLDAIDSAIEFEVQGGDFYGSGRLPHDGVFMIPANWSIQNGVASDKQPSGA